MTPQPGAQRRAREQATAYDSVFASTPLELDNGETVMVPPHPNLRLLDDDRQEAYEELLFETESYDREDDLHIPEQTLSSGVVLPAEIRRGALKVPFRKENELVKPPHSVRVVQVCLGDEEYAKLRAGGKSAGDVWRIWNQQGLDLAEREAGDPKSGGSPGAVVPISRGNSG